MSANCFDVIKGTYINPRTQKQISPPPSGTKYAVCPECKQAFLVGESTNDIALCTLHDPELSSFDPMRPKTQTLKKASAFADPSDLYEDPGHTAD